MRIAMISEHASPLAVLGGADAGGQNVYVGALAAALAARGHHVDVYTRRDAPDLPVTAELCAGVTVVHVPAGPAKPIPKDELPAHMPAFSRWLLRAWSGDRRPDIAHAHFWMSGTATVPAAKGLAIPMVQTFHALGSVKRRYQGEADTSPPQRIRQESALGRWADLVIATCSDEVNELSSLGVPADRIRIVPCGVDIGRFTPDGAVWPKNGRYRLLSLGRMVERKGIDTVIRALPELPEAELQIAGGPPSERLGDDPEARRLSAVADELGVSDRVSMLGSVQHDEVPALIRSADTVVTTPWYEPFGIVPLEAMSCARPVLGSAVGGLLDSIADGETGLLVPPRDPAAVAEAAGRLLADETLRHRLGRNGRLRAESRFDWTQVASQVEDAYIEVADRVRGLEAVS